MNEKAELKAGDDEDDFSDQSDEKPKAKAPPKKKKWFTFYRYHMIDFISLIKARANKLLLIIIINS